MDFKTLSPAYLTSLGAIFCGALLIGSSTPWVLWLGWILLIAALCLNVSVGKAKGNPVPALVTNLDGLESTVETRIRERAEQRREDRERREEEEARTAEQPSEAYEQEAEQNHSATAQDEAREEEPTESQPVVPAPAGRLGGLPSRARAAGRAPKPRANVR